MINKKRHLVSLILLCSFIVLTVTGILMFFSGYSEGVEIAHYTFGFLFTLIALFHLANNRKSLVQYLKKSKRIK